MSKLDRLTLKVVRMAIKVRIKSVNDSKRRLKAYVSANKDYINKHREELEDLWK